MKISSIRTLFDKARPIDRQITSVINYGGETEQQLEREIREYEVTDNLARHYERFMVNLSEGFQSGGGHEIGVWVSGFYGSGKSSFTKYLGFALDPARQIKSQPFLKWLQNQFPTAALRQQLQTLATRFPATVIMLDLAAVASAQAIAAGVSRLLYWKVLEWAGYSREEKIALLELLLERDGKLEAFQKRIEKEARGQKWEKLKHDTLVAKTLVSRVVTEFYKEIWPDAKAFNDIKIDSICGEDERVRQMLDLVERRTGNRRVLFIVDEVGQFIEGNPQLILNVQGLAENLKNIGKGQAWIVATAQQTLPVTGPLFKLKDRFPEALRVDIESSDIKEITYRRLLRKSPEADDTLKGLYKANEGALTHATHLKNTQHHMAFTDEAVFARLYPFLPQHFSILMELLRTLARSTGGIGLRSAIKVIQDVLVDVSGQRRGEKLLADAEVGALATADVFFDTLRIDIERANRPLVEAVNQVVTSRGKDTLPARVAKAIAVLQLVEGFPVSQANVAAVLYPAVGVKPPLEEVQAAIKVLLADKALPLSEIDGSLRFMSAAVSVILTEKQTLEPAGADINRIIADQLRDILTPAPSAQVENTLTVKVQVKQLQGDLPMAITHERSEIELHLELLPPADLPSSLKKRENDSRQTSNQHVIYLLGEESSQIRDLVREIYRCDEVHKRHRTEAAEKDVADFVRAQGQRAEALKRELDTAVQNAFLKGSFVFRGQPRAVSTLGIELLAACKSQLTSVADAVFGRYKEAPLQADASLAEKLLLTRDLANCPTPLNPLSLIQKRGNATTIDTQHASLLSIQDYLRKHGQVDGKKLLEDFQRAPFGWYKDTTRYLAAALLLAGRLRLRVGAQWIKVSGEKALEALKSNVAFGKVDVALNDQVVDPQVSLRAAQRLLRVTGQNVLPMPQNISRAVQEHFPRFQREYASLASELTHCRLPGTDRAERLLKQLGQVLQGDASEAPTVLGAEECDLIESLLWARDAQNALDQKFDQDAIKARDYLDEIPRLPRIGAADALINASETVRTDLNALLEREDFHEVTAEVRQRLATLESQIQGAAAALTGEVAKHLQVEADAIRGLAEWSRLPEGDRGSLSQQIDELSAGEATDLAGMRAVLNRRLECDSQLARIRRQVVEKARQIEAQPPAPPSPAPVPTPGQPAAPAPATLPAVGAAGEKYVPPKQLKLRRRLEVVDLPPVIQNLQDAHQQGAGVELELE